MEFGADAAEDGRRRAEIAGIPLFQRLEIETFSHCNRACWFCPRTYDRSGKYHDATGAPVLRRMETAVVLDLLDQAADLGFRGSVAFCYLSEPLLDKRHFRFAEEARRRGMRPFLHTNGDAMRGHDDLCRRVAETYDRVVVGLYDYTCVQTLDEERRFWRSRLAGTDLAFSEIGLNGAASGESSVTPRALTPPDGRVRIPDMTYPNGPCGRPTIRLIVQYDGVVCNCCEDVGDAFGLGNVHAASLRDIWYSDRHRQIVHDLAAGHRAKYALCRRCPQFPSGPRPDGERIRFEPRAAG